MPEPTDALGGLLEFLADYGLGLTVLVLLVGFIIYALVLSGRQKDGKRQTPILVPGSELDAFREQAKATEERIRADAMAIVSRAETERLEERKRRMEADAKLDKALDLLEKLTNQLVELRIDVARTSTSGRRESDERETHGT